ncbi:hypothetical protein GCM10009660_06130 [Catellatospora bangladeshensis]
MRIDPDHGWTGVSPLLRSSGDRNSSHIAGAKALLARLASQLAPDGSGALAKTEPAPAAGHGAFIGGRGDVTHCGFTQWIAANRDRAVRVPVGLHHRSPKAHSSGIPDTDTSPKSRA